MRKLFLTLVFGAALVASSASRAQMTEYETRMVALAEKNLEQNRITAAYQRCAASKTMMPFVFLDACLASFGVTPPGDKPVVASQALPPNTLPR